MFWNIIKFRFFSKRQKANLGMDSQFSHLAQFHWQARLCQDDTYLVVGEDRSLKFYENPK